MCEPDSSFYTHPHSLLCQDDSILEVRPKLYPHIPTYPRTYVHKIPCSLHSSISNIPAFLPEQSPLQTLHALCNHRPGRLIHLSADISTSSRSLSHVLFPFYAHLKGPLLAHAQHRAPTPKNNSFQARRWPRRKAVADQGASSLIHKRAPRQYETPEIPPHGVELAALHRRRVEQLERQMVSRSCEFRCLRRGFEAICRALVARYFRA
ncbi:hypothetical protein BJ875DRAFT_451826 [Amylocarpus encephaloides]|uniref:Uncharacterized protein n=1 Tax=Amylocarpus encephaloides TaxID=45428 RepID=A0A9P7YRN3_9HELO|nr:hypothetical protein BJ875DRAFT_451826 [Amylocarpus encephaloides]